MSDTLAALKTALAPKPGMKRIPLPLESYEYLSPPLTQKRLLNMFAEAAPDDSRTAAALVAANGDIFAGLWYPVIVAAVTFLLGALFLRETKGHKIQTV